MEIYFLCFSPVFNISTYSEATDTKFPYRGVSLKWISDSMWPTDSRVGHVDLGWRQHSIVWSKHALSVRLTTYCVPLHKCYTLKDKNLLKKLMVSQLVKKFPAFHGTRRFITVFTTARHWSLSCATSIEFTPSQATSLKSILMLSFHLRLSLPSGLFPPLQRQKKLLVHHELNLKEERSKVVRHFKISTQSL
jgi:hypothetical protein